MSNSNNITDQVPRTVSSKQDNSDNEGSFSTLSSDTTKKTGITHVSLGSSNSMKRKLEDLIDDPVLAKREYNRLSAAKNRKKQKDRIDSLRAKLAEVSKILREEERRNAVLTAQVKVMQEQNDRLLERETRPAIIPPQQPQFTDQSPELMLLKALGLFK